jgi:glycosyltransferase involved in cell wall biosynthesis
MKVVWLSIHFPLSPKSGGEVASARMLASLASLGCEVFSIHIAYSAPPAEALEAFREKYNLAGVSFITTARESFAEKLQLGFFLLAMLPFMPLAYSRLMWPKVRRKYRAVLSRLAQSSPRAPVLLICDQLQPCALLRAEGLDPGVRYAYRAHNVERDMWKSAGGLRRGLARAFMFYQAWRVERLERWVLRRFDQVHAISLDDLAALRSMCTEPQKVHFTPVAMDDPLAKSVLPRARSEARAAAGGGEGLRLLFLGYLAWLPNRDGLTWFLDRVFGGLLDVRPSVSLTVAGAGGQDLANRYGESATLRFSGYVSEDELRHALLSHDLLIVPIFSGAGVRIKVLEAALHGLASIGTDLGMSGSTLRPETDFLRADADPQDWIRRLSEVRVSDCEAFGRSAFNRVSGTFARNAVERALGQRLREAFQT